MTLRVWMQLAALFLFGASCGYTLAVYHGWKERRRHQLQVSHLRDRLRARG